MKKVTLLLLIIVITPLMAYSQKVSFEEVEMEYSLPPVDTLPKGLNTFSFRSHPVSTRYQKISSANFLNGKYTYIDIRGWKYVDKNPQFYLDCYLDSAHIKEQKIVEKKRDYGQKEYVYQYTFTLPVTAKLVTEAGNTFKEIVVEGPQKERIYLVDPAYAQYRWGLVLEKGFQDPKELKKYVDENEKEILKDLETEKIFETVNNGRLKKAIENIYSSKKMVERFEVGSAKELEKTSFDQQKIDEAFNLSMEFYKSVKENYLNLERKAGALRRAVELWSDQLAIAVGKREDPFYLEMQDLLSYNIAAGLMYLNSFDLSMKTLSTINTHGEYGALGKSVRYQNMQKRAERLEKIIVVRSEQAALRNWKNITQ